MPKTITDKPKPIRYCEHVQNESARPYVRLSGPKYDLIVCWNCQNSASPFLVEIDKLTARLRDALKPK